MKHKERPQQSKFNIKNHLDMLKTIEKWEEEQEENSDD